MKIFLKKWIGLVDQAFVSGCSFIIGILLARSLGVEAFGAYIVAITFLLYANTFQSSLVVAPMMTAIAHETDESRRQVLLSGFFGCALTLSMATVLGVELVTYGLGSMFDSLHLGSNAGPLALAILGFQFQDWLRRALYAQQKSIWAFFLDTLAYGGQLTGLAFLSIGGLLTPASALLLFAVVFSLAGLLVAALQSTTPKFSQAIKVAHTYWRESRNFFIAWQMQWAGAQGVMLYGVAILGKELAAGMRATQNIVGPINIIFQWMDNVVVVKAVSQLKSGGIHSMRKYLLGVTLAGAFLLGLLFTCLLFFSDQIITFLYGQEYAKYSWFIVFQSAYLFFSHLYRMECYALRVMGETLNISYSSVIFAVLAVVISVFGIPLFREKALLSAPIAAQIVAYIFVLYHSKNLGNSIKN